MDLSLERDSSILGSLFQHIINDLKNTSPLWEDFVAKAAKLHACLRAAIQAIAAYLDAFQKIADAATNSRGASKEIGTALTRVCLRHKAVETRLKTFTAAIMDCLVQPLQEKLEDWKRTVAAIDKEHAKEYKRCRTELKKRSSDTLRLQKKARKGQSDTIQSLMDSHMQDVTLRRAELEEVEKKSLRSVMIEERLRYCTFVHMLQPVVKEECEVMSELGHLQEAMQSIANVTKDPSVLPAASEELIQDAKVSMSLYPESPGGGSGSQGACSNSLGSRKSSVCSISSMNSSGSSNSPGHHHYPRSLSQLISPAIRLKPGESSDSGFCSSPALTTQASNVTNQSHAASTWPPHSQDAVPLPPNAERPHTISTTYEKGHQRPPLTVYTFQNPETIHEGGTANGSNPTGSNASGPNTPSTQKSPANTLSRPPLPVRCSSLERPMPTNNTNSNNRNGTNLRHCPSPIPAHITKELSTHHAQQVQQQQQQHQPQLQQQSSQQSQQQVPASPPTYVNMSELANMAALKISNQQQTQQPMLQQQHSIDSISSQHSNESSGSANQQQQQYSNSNPNTPHPPMKSARSHSTSSSSVSSHSVSLHSHASLESTVATPLVGQTPTPSSGSSTPQNHYSPLLTNSPSSTAAGTPSGASITSNMTGNFVYNVCSPTPPVSATSTSTSGAEAVLKITESDNNQTQVQNISSNQAQTPSTTSNVSASVSNSVSASEISQNPNSNNSAIDTDSPTIIENDERSRASVLQKASMFEKQAAAVAASVVGGTSIQSGGIAGSRTSGDSGIYGTRRLDDQQHYRTGNQLQQDSGEQLDVDKSFEDSIQELNNLIGELDSFQREIDESKQQQQQKEQQQQHQQQRSVSRNRTYSNIDQPFPTNDLDITIQNSTAATTATTPQTTMTIISSSNQTNSSGCGTDISDTTSDELMADTRSVTSLNFHSGNQQIHHNNGRGGLKQQANYNSDSELSRCYVSDTSSLTGGGGIGCIGGDGYENPTFAHFSAVATSTNACDSISQVSSELCGQERQAFIINADDGDNSSAVVVIYDHQIPITPDIDYVKQNSEIVVLRTKDPQQQQQPQQEMRELHQLPANLSGTPPESPTSPSGSSTPHTATIAPAKQRLSSFRASSEQQLQLLGLSEYGNRHQHQQQHQQGKGTLEGVKSSFKSAKADNVAMTTTAKVENEKRILELSSPALLPTMAPSDTIIRRKLPPKPPSLSIFNGSQNSTNLEAKNNHNSNLNISYSNKGNKAPLLPAKPIQQPHQQQQQQQMQLQQQQTPTLTPLTFKADLDAKLRKQKQKLLQQEQEHQQQTQQTYTNSSNNSNNCNANNSEKNNSSNCSSCKFSQTNVHSNIIQHSNYLQENASLSQPKPHQQIHNHSQKENHYSNIDSQNDHNHHPHHLQNNHHHQQKYNAKNDKQNHMQYQQSLETKHPPASASTLTPTTASAFSLSLSSSISQKNSSIDIINSSSMLHSNKIMPACVAPKSPASSSVIATLQSSSPAVVQFADPTTTSSFVSSTHLLCSSNAAAASSDLHSVAHIATATSKPCITPRPASLSGGGNGTRIPRRSSVNTAKPPPPVRRSSSVTPSHNATTGSIHQSEQQSQQKSTPTHTTVSNLTQQHKHTMHNSTESLPPPPAYLLDARQTQITPTEQTQTETQNGENSTTITTPTLMPNSALKVSETVKALSAMRHQPASPNALRRLQQQQQQQQPHQHQTSLQDEDEIDYTGFFNPYIEVNSYALSTATAHPAVLNGNGPKISQRTASPIYQSRRKFEEEQYYNKINHMTASSPTPSLHGHDRPQLSQTHPSNQYLQQNNFEPSLSSHTDQTKSPQLLQHHHYNQQQQQQQQQHQLQHKQQQQQQYYHQQSHYRASQQQQLLNTDAIYGNNSSFRTTSPGIYAQPKIVTNMSSFRSASPGANGQHGYQTQAPHVTSHHLPPTQPKTNPNLIAQLNARLSSKQQQNVATEGIYGSSSNSPQHLRSSSAHADHNPQHHQQQQQQQQQQQSQMQSQQHSNEAIYGRNYSNHQQQQMSSSQQHQQQLQHTYDGKSYTDKQINKIYGSFSTSSPSQSSSLSSTSSNALTASSTVTNFNAATPHFPLSSSTSSLLSKVSAFTMASSPTPSSVSSTPTMHGGAVNSQNENLYSVTNNSHKNSAAVSNQQAPQQQQYHHPNVVARQQNYRDHYMTPPPLENPPPPPISAAYATATMPRNCSTRNNAGHSLVAYAAATSSAHPTTATMPKNFTQQQRLLQQQHQYHNQQDQQQQQYHHPTAISQGGSGTSNSGAAQQHHTLNNHQRPPMPLPHQQSLQQQPQHQQQQQQTKQKSAATLPHQHTKHPPVPSRHSSIQQKIFVTTNPFIQTTAIHCHSPASVHSTPGSPTCSSPSSVASIYASHVRGGGSGGVSVSNYHPPQYHTSVGIGGSANNGSNGVAGHYTGPNSSSSHHSNYVGTNIEKAGSIRSKTKAEFLENLNAKLAKQNISGRAFAVRSLINSKALPDPRVCHESLMDQIKRGATLKRNQKINDRSAPKIL